MKKIKMILVGVAMMVAGAFLGVRPAMAVTCPSGSLRSEATSVAQCNLPEENAEGQPGNLWTTVQNIINWILAALGLVAVIMVIIGGFTYMTSQGDPAKVKRAKDTILYGIIGLVIALLAYAIVNFVLANVFGGGGTTDAGTSQQTSGN